MKRSIALLMAFTAITSLFSCKNNNKDSSSEQTVSDTAVTTSADTVQAEKSEKSTEKASKAQSDSKKSASPSSSDGNGEAPDIPEAPAEVLSLDDFNDIEIDLNVTDAAPPSVIKCHTIDPSMFDFGERMSPCKATEVRDEYCPTIVEGMSVREIEEQYYKDILETPSKGTINSINVVGGTMYCSVSYDDYCSRHSSAVFACNIDTGETRQIALSEGLDSNNVFGTINWGMGRLLYERWGVSDNEYYSSLMSIDPESGEIKELRNEAPTNIWYSDEEQIILSEYNNSGESDSIELYNFSPDSGELTHIGNVPPFTSSPEVFCEGSYAEIIDPESRNDTIIVKTPFFSLDTGLKNGKVLSVTPDRVNIIVRDDLSGAVSKTLYTYDIAAKERYILNGALLYSNFNGAGRFVVNYDSVSTQNNGEDIYLVCPELGKAFIIGNMPQNHFINVNTANKAVIITEYSFSESGNGQSKLERITFVEVE